MNDPVAIAVMEINAIEPDAAVFDLQRQRAGLVIHRDRLRDALQAVLHGADVLENAIDHPHDPAGHVDDTNHQACGQRDGPHRDHRLGPQPQGKPGSGDNQHAVHGGDGGVHRCDDTASQLAFLGLVTHRFTRILLLMIGVREQFQGGDVGVAVDYPAHEPGARIGRLHRALLDPGDEVHQREYERHDPGAQRDHQAPVSLGEQHHGADRVDQYMPQRIHRLHRRVAQRVAGLHDALGDTPGEIVLEEVDALFEHVAVVLPTNQVGHAGADGLMHQQVVQADEDRAQQQGHHHHPDQFRAMNAEKILGRRGLRQVDNAAQVVEQRHLDQRPDQSHDQKREKRRPYLTQVIHVKREDGVGRGRGRGVFEDIDQFFKTTIKHWLSHPRDVGSP
ncbi:hypothetical protein ALP03_05892 [Pseudomonas amygdali pv. tabaci]|uniref:Uncharacterized protein n=1 Tax=Pseudomonas amygdali pv. tabaci TaxID=322 RepID=A0A3M6I7T2_PSEAJ|nr:hypothetical protein ALP03_05892 [Pseudomonas amygdali pv. tabaci]